MQTLPFGSTSIGFALPGPVVEFSIILSFDLHFLEVGVSFEELVAEFFHQHVLFVNSFLHQVSLTRVVQRLLLPFGLSVFEGLHSFVSQIYNISDFVETRQMIACVSGLLLRLRYSIQIRHIMMKERLKHGDHNHLHKAFVQGLFKNLVQIEHLVEDLSLVLDHKK